MKVLVNFQGVCVHSATFHPTPFVNFISRPFRAIALAAALTVAGLVFPAFGEDPKPADVSKPIETKSIEGSSNPNSAQPNSQTVPSNVVSDNPFPAATPKAVVEVSHRVFPAVVRLDVAQEIYSEGKRTLRRGIGSGVIIDKDGRILTNFHVAGRAAEIYVTLFNKERVPAKLVGDDHWTDIAVVQMDKDVIAQRKIEFQFAELGDSKSLITGQDVVAMGTPHGFARTLTLGVVSNEQQTFYPESLHIDEYETGEFSNWIQMDTPINPGNSGGPLLDLNGKVVGINTRGGGQNLNFAIPIDTAKEVIAKILATASAGTDRKGRVERSDLGIQFKPLQDLEAFYNIDINRGALVNSVDRGAAAEKAGVKTQDILLEVNGKPVNVRFPEEMAAARKMIADLPVNTDVTLKLKRGQDTISLIVKTQKLEGAVGEEKELKAWGVSVRDVTRAYANDRLLDDDLGVVITSMTPGLPAQKAELSPGDVIRSINGAPVEDLDAVLKIFDESVKKKETKVLLEVNRGRGTQTAILKVTHGQ